jgi:serine protease Do
VLPVHYFKEDQVKKIMSRPLTWVIALLIVSQLACNLGAGTTTPGPANSSGSPSATPQSLAEPTATKSSLNTPTTDSSASNPSPQNQVTTLKDAQKATIQIESVGTFVDPQMGMVVNGAGRGSGFIIDPSGIAITNNHVVTGAAELKVWIGGNKDKQYHAKVLGATECSDLAVIQIEGSNFPYLTWHEGTPDVGLEVYAAGYPLGDPQFTLTKGIVSKAQADGNTSWASIDNVIEHDARINPGNSGGPLIDSSGKVVGINYASNSANQYFAITKAEADSVLNQLRAGYDVNSIGVNGQAVQGKLQDGTDIAGVWVSSVKAGSPADKAKIVAGDIITQLAGLVLATDGTMKDYCGVLRSHKSTDTLDLTILRWSSQEVLTGQLNGRPLEVAYSYFSNQYGNTTTSQGNSGSSQSGYTYTTLTDDSGSISVDIPTVWTSVDGSAWKDTWTLADGRTFDFNAPDIEASTDLKVFNSSFDAPGVQFAASTDLAQIGGYAQLLEGVMPWFQSDCKYKSRNDYKDTIHEGKYDLWENCGSQKTSAISLAMRPISDPTGYLILIVVKIVSNDDLDALDRIISTYTIK